MDSLPASLRPRMKNECLPSPGRSRSERVWEKLYILVTTKGTNLETLERSRAMHHLETLDDRISFMILTDEGSGADTKQEDVGVSMIRVPKSFSPTKAKHKARAMEYFRLRMELGDNDWVLHLDEETIVDTHCVLSCISFIERAPEYDLGQGIIMYNTVNYWRNPFLTFAEISRVRDDLGRFQFMQSTLHLPLWGAHGSFFLVSGKVENAVTFNTDCITEDFWFANRAWWDHGFRIGHVPSVVREQSNWTLMDLLKQRRRWIAGNWEVGVFGKCGVGKPVCMDASRPQLTDVVSWFVLGCEPVLATVLRYSMVTIPHSLALVLKVHLLFNLFTYAFATFLSDLDAGLSPWIIAIHVLLSPVLAYIAGIIGLLALIYAVVRPISPDKFDIVKKG
ncbi:glycosyltransferase family 2 protein [Cercospora zeae-maydis SCOH1-5]|uniref:Glycosyltransferase family 2 protein n=1 Tax=Cercospora zeae-maydis SCOH1-5 TaxID=717836 RepID=A0A6A6FAG0_9PEZI|nr:glycosyltransferase family 2 protein [Cercospora zeae-maydis SCOH1-5]